MKKSFLTTTGKLIPVIPLLLVVSATRAQSVGTTIAYYIPATGNEPIEIHPGSIPSAEVRYVGSPEGEPSFRVVYANSTGARFSIKILDSEGHLLFQSVYTDKKFDRKFKVADARNYDKLTFVIRNFQDSCVQSFEINPNAPVIEAVKG